MQDMHTVKGLEYGEYGAIRVCRGLLLMDREVKDREKMSEYGLLDLILKYTSPTHDIILLDNITNELLSHVWFYVMGRVIWSPQIHSPLAELYWQVSRGNHISTHQASHLAVLQRPAVHPYQITPAASNQSQK